MKTFIFFFPPQCFQQLSELTKFTFHTLSGLHPGRSYDVRVLAATLKGYPDLPDDQLPWKIVENPSNFTEVPVVPIVHLNVVNSTSIEVSGSYVILI